MAEITEYQAIVPITTTAPVSASKPGFSPVAIATHIGFRIGSIIHSNEVFSESQCFAPSEKSA
ncbi:hypothetical protein FACS1894163_13510 [Spirochaetia bacterium]|nr:hypothetical protein FACS1894163_13510 [Spirochaetia bacterium]